METWKGLIYGKEDLSSFYEVSDNGKIRNSRTKYELKLALNSQGYNYVCVSLGSQYKRKHFSIHRAVAETFIPNFNDLPEVNHKDTIKINNTVSNLEWITREGNIEHARKLGLIGAWGEKNSQSKLSNKQAQEIRDIRKTGLSYRKIARLYNTTHATIIDICKGRSYIK